MKDETKRLVDWMEASEKGDVCLVDGIHFTLQCHVTDNTPYSLKLPGDSPVRIAKVIVPTTPPPESDDDVPVGAEFDIRIKQRH